MIYLDTETCGLHGVPVLLQYAINDGPIELYDIWINKISDTIELFELISKHKGGVCGFNLVFDWFHINKFYNVLLKVVEKYPLLSSCTPINCIDQIYEVEAEARDGICLKPVTALDLMLVAKKGKYQSTMERSDIRIKKVPVLLADPLSDELNRTIKLKPLYFARRKDKDSPWHVLEHKDMKTGEIDPEFRDIVLKFAPSGALKALAVDALNLDPATVLKFGDVEVDKKLRPEEVGYAPYAAAVGRNKGWPIVVKYHVEHWRDSAKAREYAALDVDYLRRLRPILGQMEPGDVDSVLACAAACIRWKGYRVDLDRLKQLKIDKAKLLERIPQDTRRVREWLWPLLSSDEQLFLEVQFGKSTKKVMLESLSKWTMEEEQPDGTVINKPHPVAKRAKAVLDARSGKKEIELYDKILLAGRFHASFKIIGALSGRMSGADGLNAQGIKSTKEVRSCFLLSWLDQVLMGGDMEAFEVVIAVASYEDKQLEAALLAENICADCHGTGFKLDKKTLKPTEAKCGDCKGKGRTKQKIHGLFGACLYGKTYEEIALSKGTAFDMYTKGKQGVFSQMYGGNEHTLMDRLGLSEDDALRGMNMWAKSFPGVKNAQARILNSLQSMKQAGDVGSKITWAEPVDFIASLLGFKRFFSLENSICKALYNLAASPPKAWTNLKVKVVRREREQSVAGAVRSALFAAAFAIQSANVRAGTNHEIQATGAEITKNVQAAIWELQPAGPHPFIVMPMNIHDEIMTPTNPAYTDQVTEKVNTAVEKYRSIIPLIAIAWEECLASWAEK